MALSYFQITGFFQEQILANTPSMQAVQHIGLNITQVVFYEPGIIEWGNGFILSVDKPCIVMVKVGGNKIERISVSDPTREQEDLQVSLSAFIRGKGANWNAAWNDHDNTSIISVELPRNEWAGNTVIIDI